MALFPSSPMMRFDFRRSERRNANQTEVALKRRKDSPAVVDVPASLLLKKRHQLPPHRYVLAPMVGGSELPFRMMTRRYGTQLCYTPMIYSGPFSKDQARLLSQNCSEIQKSQTIYIHLFLNEINVCQSYCKVTVRLINPPRFLFCFKYLLLWVGNYLFDSLNL